MVFCQSHLTSVCTTSKYWSFRDALIPISSHQYVNRVPPIASSSQGFILLPSLLKAVFTLNGYHRLFDLDAITLL